MKWWPMYLGLFAIAMASLALSLVFSQQSVGAFFAGIIFLTIGYWLTCIGVDWKGHLWGSWGILFVALVVVYYGFKCFASIA